MFEWDKQPDPLIDDYLEMLECWHLTRIQIRNRELVVKAFEVHLLGKGLSVYEATPLLVQGYLCGLIARSGSTTCLRRHWEVLREYFGFLTERGCFVRNPVEIRIYPQWGAEHIGKRRG